MVRSDYRGRVPRHRLAVTVVFALNGMLFASLFARMPAIKDDAHMSSGELGAALLAAGLALIASQLAGGAISARVGSRPGVIAGAALYGLLLPLPALAESGAAFAGLMVLLALGAGVLDVAMNAQGALAEERSPRRIFSSFHAAFSIGALAGALTGGLAAALGIDPVVHLAAVGAVGAAIGVATSLTLPSRAHDANPDSPLFAVPSRPLAALAAIALCVLLLEGSVGDWSAVLLREEHAASEGVAALGLAAFSLLMAAGRLGADPLAERLGRANTLRLGAVLGAVGALVTVLPLGPGPAVAGYALMGAGLAGIFPLALRAATELPGSIAATSIAAVSTVGYAGFLLGPAAIGFLAEVAGLSVALAIAVPVCAMVALLAPAARERPA